MYDYFNIQFKTDKVVDDRLSLKELNERLDDCRRGRLTESSKEEKEVQKGDEPT